MIYNQIEFDLRCEWGKQGVEKLAPISDVIIIVDVLSFSTCVELATNNNAIIFPFSTTIAVATFQAFQKDLLSYLQKCSSGKELIAKGFESDIELASAYNVSNCVPVFTENGYIKEEVN